MIKADAIGAEGFNWEEVEIERPIRWGRTEDMYFYIKDEKPAGLYIKRDFVELANIKPREPLKLFAQGTAIFMLKKDRYGTIMTGKTNGRYVRLGNASLARKLYEVAKEYEVIEAVDDYILFRPLR